MRRTGLVQGLGGAGLSESSMRKSPSEARGTPAAGVECAVALAAGPQKSVACTLWPALVPIPFPPARSNPRPFTSTRPSVRIVASSLRMV